MQNHRFQKDTNIRKHWLNNPLMNEESRAADNCETELPMYVRCAAIYHLCVSCRFLINFHIRKMTDGCSKEHVKLQKCRNAMGFWELSKTDTSQLAYWRRPAGSIQVTQTSERIHWNCPNRRTQDDGVSSRRVHVIFFGVQRKRVFEKKSVKLETYLKYQWFRRAVPSLAETLSYPTNGAIVFRCWCLVFAWGSVPR